MVERVTINVDGRPIEAGAGELLIAACEEGGVYIPRFCWHPRLRSVGMCRMCLVEIEGMRGLQPACYVPVTDGMEVRTQSPAVKKAQEGVLEFLLINHPLDCPVCDRGGECPLQDQTLAFGPGESRFVEEKRHFEKPVPISDLVLLDRERCIQCGRCVRAADEVAGDPLIDFSSRGNDLQITTFPDEPFKSYFSGNTVQVCPVGALTAAPYRFKARPWDISAVETTCTMCSVGCRGALQQTRNTPVRLLGVDIEATNWGWLCDKGRFGHEYVSHPDRLTRPAKGRVPVTWAEAIDEVADRIGDLRAGGRAAAAIGGARLTNEEAYALSKFMRVVCGTNDVDCQLDDGLPGAFVAGATGRAGIADLDSAAAVVLAAPDLKEELPVLYLRVRSAVVDTGVPLFVAGGRQSGLDRHAVARVARASDLDPAALPDEGDVVVVVGRQHLGQDPEALAAWAQDFAAALGDRARLMPVLRRANAHGALDMGLSPELLPGRVAVHDHTAREQLSSRWAGSFPLEAGRSTRAILETAAAGGIAVLFVVGADPLVDFPDPDLARRGVEGADYVVAIDLFATETAAHADLVLPAAGWGEVDGTVTNLEGRVQRVAASVVAPGQAASDAQLFREVAEALGIEFGCGTARATMAEIAEVVPAYGGVTASAFRGGAGREGVVVRSGDVTWARLGEARELDATSGGATTGGEGLALRVGRTLYDRGTLVAHCPSLAELGPGSVVRLHPDTAAEKGMRDGDKIVVSVDSEGFEAGVVVDPGAVPGVAFVPHAQGGAPLALGPTKTVTLAKRGS
ncbi:MAG: NADH-quinone oxidoreductase subunit NuoG [Acidimicrobiia bacterium]